jgi:hypothetical protein
MAKRRYSTKTAARHLETNRSIRSQTAEIAPGHVLVGIVHSGPPDHHSISFFIRRCATVADAISAWAVDDSDGASKEWRGEIGRRILLTLGGDRWDDWPTNVDEPRFSYEAAEKEINQLAIEEKESAGSWELHGIVKPILVAYSSPLRFFCVTAPRLAPGDFQVHPGNDVALRKTFWRWGYGALLNPQVRKAFDWLALNRTDRFNKMLEFVENRQVFTPDGRKKGRRDSAPRKRKSSKYTDEWRNQIARSASSIETKARKSTGGVKAILRARAQKDGLSSATITREYYRKTHTIKKPLGKK